MIQGENSYRQRAFALRHKDSGELKKSQSGAAFVALSDKILEEEGVIYGVSYGENLKVVHKRATSKSDRDAFQGSKYVQSSMIGIHTSILLDLKNGKTVLFSGTPCQVASIKKFIPVELRDRLILVDLVCHGVVSPFLWQDYVVFLEDKYRSRIINAKFRDKKFGWHAQRESFTFANGKTIYPSFLIYSNMFIKKECTRCPFSNMKRVGDLTLGDFWGVEKLFPDFADDDKGCSLVICNSKKGFNLLEDIIPDVEILEAPCLDDCLQMNLQHATPLHPNHVQFMEMYKRKGFKKTIRRFGLLEYQLRIRHIIRRIKERICE